MPRGERIIGHWHKRFESFSTSALDFYTRVEEAIVRREIPNVAFSRVEAKEAGVLSASRAYLRITRSQYNFDLCAAPFGKDYFFSWWLAMPVYDPLYFFAALGLIFPASMACFIATLFTWSAPFMLPFAYAGLLFVFGFLVRSGYFNEGRMLATPFFGKLYEKIFNPETYFRMDTEIMFREAVHAAVMEVVEETTSASGLELSEADRKAFAPEFLRT